MPASRRSRGLRGDRALGLVAGRAGVEVHIQRGIPSFAIVGLVDRAVYSASKGAVLALTRAMAADEMPYGIVQLNLD